MAANKPRKSETSWYKHEEHRRMGESQHLKFLSNYIVFSNIRKRSSVHSTEESVTGLQKSFPWPPKWRYFLAWDQEKRLQEALENYD